MEGILGGKEVERIENLSEVPPKDEVETIIRTSPDSRGEKEKEWKVHTQR
jgi:hypothetical protein